MEPQIRELKRTTQQWKNKWRNMTKFVAVVLGLVGVGILVWCFRYVKQFREPSGFAGSYYVMINPPKGIVQLNETHPAWLDSTTLTLMASCGALLICVAFIVFFRRISLSRMLLCTFFIGLMASVPQAWEPKFDSRARITIWGNFEILSEIKFKTLNAELQPAVAMQSMPDELLAELNLEPGEGFLKLNLGYGRFDEGEINIIFDVKLTAEQKETLLNFYVEYIDYRMRKLDSGYECAPPLTWRQYDALWEKYRAQWRQKLEAAEKSLFITAPLPYPYAPSATP